MRVLALLFAGLVATVEASYNMEITIEMCEIDQCNCQAPQGQSERSLTRRDDLGGCHCLCGSLKGEDCDRDEDCVSGLTCGAGSHKDKPGQCEDACVKHKQKCGLYEKCIIEAGKPVCTCSKMFDCTERVIGPICALDTEDNTTSTYLNPCLLANENCKRLRNGKKKLKQMQKENCAEVHHEEISGASLGAFRFDKRY
ncbi:uncharacterized protein LOC110983126 [Acanthaster planci]|uniref:Uncharacterized protein LOC110983126 n=1 Tax=Acanthaster planci TaxID=133434 RepID=A0A8B7YYM0_ACAPL|nr:uncharacterized protein LOC110983126 [Acanthaster planci]